MATVQRKLVHKQFNSPMGLYSQQNVKETLDRELKAFGADGIEVDPEITKPLNLANSAVLRAVEEEEQIKCGYKRVAWPPVSEERVVREFTPQPTSAHYPVSGSLQQQPEQQHQPPQQQQQQQQQHAAPANQYRATSYDQYQTQPQAQKYQPHQGSQPPYAQQAYSLPQQQQQPSWAHNQPIQQYQPAQAPYQQGLPQPQQQQYQPVHPSNYQSQAYHQSPQQQQPQHYSTVPQSNQYNSYSQPQRIGQDQPDHQTPVQQHQAQNLPQDYRGGSPGIITLRKEAPVSQKPTPVYNAQPAAVSFQGGSNMRGDLKWPPPEYKEAAIRENEERRKLSQGPVCRPRKVNRDYTTFFAKNALNSYYPSYKIPPGTQHMLA